MYRLQSEVVDKNGAQCRLLWYSVFKILHFRIKSIYGDKLFSVYKENQLLTKSLIPVMSKFLKQNVIENLLFI